MHAGLMTVCSRAIQQKLFDARTLKVACWGAYPLGAVHSLHTQQANDTRLHRYNSSIHTLDLSDWEGGGDGQGAECLHVGIAMVPSAHVWVTECNAFS